MIQIVHSRVGAGFENNETFLNYYQYGEYDVDLALVECGYEKCDPRHYWMGRKGFHIIHVISSGKGVLEVEGRRYELHAGDGFYIAPDQEVKYTADEQEPWEYRWIGFMGTRAVIALNSISLPDTTVFRVDDLQRVCELLQKIYEHISRMTEQGKMMALGYLHFFLAWLMEAYGEKKKLASNSQELVNLATEMIHEYYAGNFGVQDLCKRVNVTRSYLYKLFMRYYKISPSSFLLKFRLEKAREILASQRCTIDSVVERTGFSSHTYFTKCFRQAYGITPREYLRSLHKEEDE